MARVEQVQGYTIHVCERCDFAYKDAATADECALYDLAHDMRSPDITGKSIARPARHYQASLAFIEEELKAAKAKAAAAAKAAATPATPATPGAAPATPAATAGAAPKPALPKLTPEELEARKKAALEKAAAAKAAKQA